MFNWIVYIQQITQQETCHNVIAYLLYKNSLNKTRALGWNTPLPPNLVNRRLPNREHQNETIDFSILTKSYNQQITQQKTILNELTIVECNKCKLIRK